MGFARKASTRAAKASFFMSFFTVCFRRLNAMATGLDSDFNVALG